MEEQPVVNDQIQQPPVNPVPVSKKPNLWIIAGIILVLLLVFGSIYVRSLPSRKPISPPPKPLASPPPISPTPTPIVIPTTDPLITANWKKYRNEEFGFEFQYPGSLKVYDKDTGIKSVGFIGLCRAPENTIASCLIIPPEAYPSTYFEGAVFAVLLDYYYVDNPCGPSSSREGVDTTINGITFKKYTIGNGATGHTMTGNLYSVPRNGGKICLGIQLALDKYRWEPFDAESGIKEFTEQDETEVFDRLDQILSTFKFLDGKEDNRQLGDAATKEECLAQGGVWQKWGLAQLEYCQIPAKDAGKSCTDKSQCTYGCISYTGVPGKCATYKSTFGCFSVVRNGKAEQALCAD